MKKIEISLKKEMKALWGRGNALANASPLGVVMGKAIHKLPSENYASAFAGEARRKIKEGFLRDKFTNVSVACDRI